MGLFSSIGHIAQGIGRTASFPGQLVGGFVGGTADAMSPKIDPREPGNFQLSQDAFNMPNREQWRGQLNDAMLKRQQVQEPTINASLMQAQTAAPTDYTNFNNVLGYQNQLLTQLQAAAAGQVPSAAEMQMRQGMQQSLAGQMAAAASNTGGNAALAQRNLLNAGLAQQQDVNSQAGILRAQEQAQNRALLGDVASNMANAGLNQAQISNQANQFNVNSLNQAAANNQAAQNAASMQNAANQIQNQNMIDNMTQYYTTQGLGLDQAQQAAQMQYQQMLMDQYRNELANATQRQIANTGNQQQNVNNVFGLLQNVTGGATQGMGAAKGLPASGAAKGAL